MTLKIDPKTGDGMLSNGVVFKADFLTAALGSAWQGLAKNVECELHYFARAVGKRELNREDADGFAAWLEAMPAIHGYGREKISFAIIALERRSDSDHDACKSALFSLGRLKAQDFYKHELWGPCCAMIEVLRLAEAVPEAASAARKKGLSGLSELLKAA